MGKRAGDAPAGVGTAAMDCALGAVSRRMKESISVRRLLLSGGWALPTPALACSAWVE
tara:strand:+ start:136679 stop:136852 length:174 start_codon:yes stop_codon:yes gene_type:complete